jgi:hypothetical protein
MDVDGADRQKRGLPLGLGLLASGLVDQPLSTRC